MTSAEEAAVSLKIVLLGPTGVGKTTMVTRWVTGEWDASIVPTVSVGHRMKTVDLDGIQADVYLWDTAGQEKFQALVPLYAKSASAAILVVSISDLSTFSMLGSSIQFLSNACDVQPPTILAINKMDLVDDSVRYSDDEIEAMTGHRFDAVFFVSAKTGQEINGVFMCAADEAYKFSVKAKPAACAVVDRKQNTDCC